VSSLDPSGADQIDAKHLTRNRKVIGSNPTSGSKTAGQRACVASLTAQQQPAIIPLGWIMAQQARPSRFATQVCRPPPRWPGSDAGLS
jgi:hypothetical protein